TAPAVAATVSATTAPVVATTASTTAVAASATSAPTGGARETGAAVAAASATEPDLPAPHHDQVTEARARRDPGPRSRRGGQAQWVVDGRASVAAGDERSKSPRGAPSSGSTQRSRP